MVDIDLMHSFPAGYKGLVVADRRRARQWQQGLESLGIAVVRIANSERERGSWHLGVAEADESRARAFVREVIRGEVHLPSVTSPPGWRIAAMGTVGLLLAALFWVGMTAL